MTVTTCPLRAGTAICQHATWHANRHRRTHRHSRVPSGKPGRHRRAHAISAQRHVYYEQVQDTTGVPAPAPSPWVPRAEVRGCGEPHGSATATEERGQDNRSPRVPGVPRCPRAARTPSLGAGRPSSSRLGSAGDPAPGAALCHLPLLLLAPLDVPVGLDDAGPLLLHDAPASHRHRRCRGRRGRLALAQARRQEELLPSSLRAQTGHIRGDNG